MSSSLARHLSGTLALTIGLLCVIAGAASFGLAYLEAKELQDDMLRQIATLSSGRSRVPSNLSNSADSEPESVVRVVRLPGDPRPAWFSDNLSAGFQTVNTDSGTLRVFIVAAGRDQKLAVAQPTDVRDEIAVDSALRTLIPLLILLPIAIWLIVRIVRSELAPVTALSLSVDEQPADRPRLLSADHLPDEIRPFVHAINRLLQRVTHLMGEQRRFVADAAHELRSPLTALSVQAQNLTQAASLEAMRERVAPLRAGIERTKRLTEQMLSLARTQAGPGACEIVDIPGLARQLIAEYLPLAEAKSIDLGLEERGPICVFAAPESLQLILRNGLENALKYTPHGGEVTLWLQSSYYDDIIEVVDNGPGIPAAELERAFDPFYRLPGTSGEGSGLGLAIAREAAIRLGGTLTVHPREHGSGLIFRYRQRRIS